MFDEVDPAELRERLRQLSDAELIERIVAWDRLAAWAAAVRISAEAELAKRRARVAPELGPGDSG
ncbi:hypothetical protein [uncultured Mycolicibacterium sp.]|uniref:hypothetical protein n=1 Tax=uncultured Mycolicibacterium sp. TaxID=2320817 RepID=UPI0026346169|nr:hypothetical protein [uncultured Mycolicibacterium sp.]